MDISRILFRSPFFIPSRENLSDLEYDRQHSDFLKRKDLSYIKKINGLTLGGFLASALGIVLTMFSEKAGRNFGALLTLIGLGSIAGGFYKADGLKNEGGHWTSNHTGTTNVTPPQEQTSPAPHTKSETTTPLVDVNSLPVETLIKRLADTTKNYHMRNGAIKELVQCNLQGEERKEVIEILIKYLEDEKATVRRETARALGEIGDKDVLSALKLVIKNDSNKYVKDAAQAAINKINPPPDKKKKGK